MKFTIKNFELIPLIHYEDSPPSAHESELLEEVEYKDVPKEVIEDYETSPKFNNPPFLYLKSSIKSKQGYDYRGSNFGDYVYVKREVKNSFEQVKNSFEICSYTFKYYRMKKLDILRTQVYDKMKEKLENEWNQYIGNPISLDELPLSKKFMDSSNKFHLTIKNNKLTLSTAIILTRGYKNESGYPIDIAYMNTDLKVGINAIIEGFTIIPFEKTERGYVLKGVGSYDVKKEDEVPKEVLDKYNTSEVTKYCSYLFLNTETKGVVHGDYIYYKKIDHRNYDHNYVRTLNIDRDEYEEKLYNKLINNFDQNFNQYIGKSLEDFQNTIGITNTSTSSRENGTFTLTDHIDDSGKLRLYAWSNIDGNTNLINIADINLNTKGIVKEICNHCGQLVLYSDFPVEKNKEEEPKNVFHLSLN